MSATHYECDTKEFDRRSSCLADSLAGPGRSWNDASGGRLSAKARIAKAAVDLLNVEPDGLRHSVLIQSLRAALPDVPVNTIRGSLVGLADYKPLEGYRPAKGLFRHTKSREIESPPATRALSARSPVHERDFYASFAAYLTEDLEECTKCIPLGGCKFKDKWGTPDVIGILRARKSDIVKFPAEIITAEIKLDTSSLITAFGQACSYRLFSHRCYLVIPKSSTAEDLVRLESLCLAVGLGLVLFDCSDSSNPGYSIRVRATRTEPDMFYVNRNLKPIEDQLF